MSAKKAVEFSVNKLYKFKQLTILDDNLRSKLPDAYKKFFKEWQLSVPSPVHYEPRKEKWERRETGEVYPVQNFPIKPRYPPESHRGLWGGEGVVYGLIKRKGKYASKIPHFWFPSLKRSVIYSEILNKHMSVVLTLRTINLILDHKGLDHYLLKSKAYDIQSELGVKLKRKMLLALRDKDLYNDDPAKQEEIYIKYKHYLKDYTDEEIDWYGLNMYEALMKLEEDVEPPKPMKIELRKKLIDQLKLDLLLELENNSSDEKSVDSRLADKPSWISKLNPFGGKKTES